MTPTPAPTMMGAPGEALGPATVGELRERDRSLAQEIHLVREEVKALREDQRRLSDRVWALVLGGGVVAGGVTSAINGVATLWGG